LFEADPQAAARLASAVRASRDQVVEIVAVAFRFRAVTGTWNVDDVYVDPYQRR
jgi:hypothetical protein